MKLFLSALCASFIIAPLSFASECEKGKCDKEKKEGTVLAADCGKCDSEKCKSGKCDDCDKCKKSGELLADCGKCKKKDGDKEKEEGTLLAGKCKKDGDCDKEKEAEGTLA